MSSRVIHATPAKGCEGMPDSRAVTAAMHPELMRIAAGRRPWGFDRVRAAHVTSRNTTVKLYRTGNQVGG